MPSSSSDFGAEGMVLLSLQKLDTVKLSGGLLAKLGKKYEPSSMIGMKYKGKDLSVKTDEEGNPVVLFIGKIHRDGKIKGERFTRTLKRDSKGVLIKDHWDLKGRT